MKSRPCILHRIVDELCAPREDRREALFCAATLARPLCANQPKLATLPYLDKPMSMIGVLLTAEPALYDASHMLLRATLNITRDTALSACTLELLSVLEKTPHYAAHKGVFAGHANIAPAASMKAHDWPSQTTAEHIARLLREPALLAARALVQTYRQAYQTKNDGLA